MPVRGEAYLRLAAFSFLGGDDDDAVGCTRTVDGSRRGILEDGHRLDVLRVNHRQGVGSAGVALVGHGHAVDHDKRVVGGGKRGAAADADVGVACGVTSVGRYRHTRAGAYKEVLCGCRYAGLHIVGSHDRHRSGGVRFFYRTVSDHHCLGEHGGVLFHHDVEMSLTVDRHFHRVVAHVAYHEGGVRGHRDGEVAVNVCRGSVGGAFFHHGGTD